MKQCFSFIVLSVIVFTAAAQRPQQGNMDRQQMQVEVKGVVIDNQEKQGLPGAHISLTNMRDTTRVFRTATDAQGAFRIDVARGGYTLKVTYLGYEPNIVTIRAIEASNDVGKVVLATAGAVLGEVTVTGKALPVMQKGDTLQFNAQAYKTNPDASAEDLVRKLPGLTIDPEGVKAQGETVQRILVDGQAFFGDDPNIALRNLPAEMIDRVEVFDQLSDQSQLTGFDDGERVKTINIVTRLDRRSGQFGRVYSGYGDAERYQAGLVTNLFMDKRRISIIGMSNNINQQNFSSEDLSGFMSAGGRTGGTSGGMRGGGGRPSGGGGAPTINRGDFLIGQQSGNNTTNSLGINYTDVWSSKVNVNGSYFFNLLRNESEQFANRQYYLDESTSQFYADSNLSERNNYNHRFNARVEYKINDKHTLMIQPRFSYQNTESESSSHAENFLVGDQLLNRSLTDYNRFWNGYSFSNALIYRARISEKGRSISARLNANVNNNEYLYFLDALSDYYDGPILTSDLIDQKSTTSSDSYGLSSNLTYTEPIGEKGMLQLSHNISFSNNSSDRMTNSWDIVRESYSLLESDLTSELTNGYLTNRFGLGYRLRGEKYSLLTELSYQFAELASNQVTPYLSNVDYSFQNFIPMVNYTYNFSRTNSLRMMYRSFTNAPSVNQLQDVIDNSNPLLLSSGNPDLEQSNSHFLSARYNITNVAKSQSLFVTLFGTMTSNYIGNSTIIAQQDIVLSNGYELPRGAQYSRPENMSGHSNIRSMLTYGFPLKFIKSNINLTSGIAYSSIPSKINNQKNIAKTYNTNGGVVVSSNISANVDFTLSYRLNYNIVENTLRPQLDNNYFYHLSEMRFNWVFLKGWVLRNDVSNLYYAGLGEGFNENYWLWNINLGKKIFANKQGELTIGVYDLLDQNRSVSRNVTDTYTEDLRSNVLNRFFMLTFTYNIKNFRLGEPRAN
jgi:uncharacterized membrane protein YgcG